jgi:hypothetical protein
VPPQRPSATTQPANAGYLTNLRNTWLPERIQTACQARSHGRTGLQTRQKNISRVSIQNRPRALP